MVPAHGSNGGGGGGHYSLEKFNILHCFTHFRSYCDCGAIVEATGRSADVLIYTRNGTFNAKHLEFRFIFTTLHLYINFFPNICRCKSKKCRAGFFYGFKTKGHKLFYDINCLEKAYFFTSRKTG